MTTASRESTHCSATSASTGRSRRCPSPCARFGHRLDCVWCAKGHALSTEASTCQRVGNSFSAAATQRSTSTHARTRLPSSTCSRPSTTTSSGWLNGRSWRHAYRKCARRGHWLWDVHTSAHLASVYTSVTGIDREVHCVERMTAAHTTATSTTHLIELRVRGRISPPGSDHATTRHA